MPDDFKVQNITYTKLNDVINKYNMNVTIKAQTLTDLYLLC